MKKIIFNALFIFIPHFAAQSQKGLLAFIADRTELAAQYDLYRTTARDNSFQLLGQNINNSLPYLPTPFESRQRVQRSRGQRLREQKASETAAVEALVLLSKSPVRCAQAKGVKK